MTIRQDVLSLIDLSNTYSPDSQEAYWILEPESLSMTLGRNYGLLLGKTGFMGAMAYEVFLEDVHRTDRRRVRNQMEKLLGGHQKRITLGFRMDHPRVEYHVELLAEAVRETEGSFIRGVMRFSPNGGNHSLMKSLNYHDTLTGAYNRSYFNYKTASRSASGDPGTKCAVMYMDADNFKDINDQFGHHFGDALLIAFFQRLSNLLPPGTLIARPGGDEALLLLDGVHSAEALSDVLEELYLSLKQPFDVDDRKVPLSVSTGVALCPDHGSNLDQLMISVDAALRMAKESGKGRYCFYDSSYHDELSKRLEIYSHLSQAIEKGELSLVYQPLYDIEQQRVYGAEVLLRWDSGHYGQVPPSVFIPLAEESSLILTIGDWVLENALKQLSLWKDAYGGAFMLSINISAIQFREPDFVDRVRAIIHENGVSEQNVQLELTESVFVSDYQNVKRKLEDLREMGLRIALDDFGTGYSSLNHIRNLSLDAIKIDKSFVSEITASEQDLSIARTIVALAEVLSLKVVAEGIETAEQYEVLKGIHCHRAQGYLFGRPMSPALFQERYIDRQAES